MFYVFVGRETWIIFKDGRSGAARPNFIHVRSFYSSMGTEKEKNTDLNNRDQKRATFGLKVFVDL